MRSRYHNEFPLTAKDPLTNEVIVGEVEFYEINRNQIISICETAISQSRQGEISAFEQTKVIIAGNFFGSDFNYATNK